LAGGGIGKGRVEAFSDGVIAVIITIMVLELHPPHEATLAALMEVLPKFLAYVLSFVFIGIYWNNHHHLFHSVQHVNGRILWANNYLLFILSLVPFTTDWMGETGYATIPVMVYGTVLLLAGFGYYFVEQGLARLHGPDSLLARAIGSDLKGWGSLALYALGIVAAYFNPMLGVACYVVVSVMWFIPDQRIERLLGRS